MIEEGVAPRLERTLARIERENAESRIFITVDGAGARAAARESETRLHDGLAARPLEGVLTAVKDNLAVAGLPWSAGIGGWRDRRADRDSNAVARLRAAGAVIVGTLNMHEGALGATSDNPAFGRCQNPLHAGHTPGGSSGGSGAALAAGLVDLTLGTDTMGSVRIPAAYCGVAGLKPSDGLIGRAGLALLCPSLDCIGPLAPRVADLRVPLSVLAGPDGHDPLSRPAPPDLVAPAGETVRPADLSGRRLVRLCLPGDVEPEPEVMHAFEDAVAAAAAAGAEIVERTIDGWSAQGARRAGLLLIEAEAAREMAAFVAEDAPAEAVSAEFRAMLDYGRRVPAERVLQAWQVLRGMAAAVERTLGGVDALLLPTAPQRAFPHDGATPVNQAELTAPANFAGLPALSLPVPLAGETLPGAVQLIGHRDRDLDLLDVGEGLERALASSL